MQVLGYFVNVMEAHIKCQLQYFPLVIVCVNTKTEMVQKNLHESQFTGNADMNY